MRRIGKPRMMRRMGQRVACGNSIDRHHQPPPQHIGAKGQADFGHKKMAEAALRKTGNFGRLTDVKPGIDVGREPCQHARDTPVDCLHGTRVASQPRRHLPPQVNKGGIIRARLLPDAGKPGRNVGEPRRIKPCHLVSGKIAQNRRPDPAFRFDEDHRVAPLRIEGMRHIRRDKNDRSIHHLVPDVERKTPPRRQSQLDGMMGMKIGIAPDRRLKRHIEGPKTGTFPQNDAAPSSVFHTVFYRFPGRLQSQPFRSIARPRACPIGAHCRQDRTPGLIGTAMPKPIARRAILLSIPCTVLLSGAALAGVFSGAVPDDLDLSLTRISNGGLYRAQLSPEALPITVRQMHIWTVTLQTAAGAPASRASIAISGGMPQHGHGLPTAPQVTKSLGNGRYQIEGVKFNMRGWWTFELAINGANGADVVTFNIIL